MTFSDLHKAIQIAFEWADYHLHGFDVRRSNSVQINNPVYIGPTQHEFSDFDYNEVNVLLKDVFIRRKIEWCIPMILVTIGSMRLFWKK
jgi:hypothetical protein